MLNGLTSQQVSLQVPSKSLILTQQNKDTKIQEQKNIEPKTIKRILLPALLTLFWGTVLGGVGYITRNEYFKTQAANYCGKVASGTTKFENEEKCHYYLSQLENPTQDQITHLYPKKIQKEIFGVLN